MDVSYVGYPNLVDAIHCVTLDQVGINPKTVVAVGCTDPFSLARLAAPALLTHDPGNFLVVDDPAFALKLFGYPAISVPGKVQANLLHTFNECLIRRLFLRFVVNMFV